MEKTQKSVFHNSISILKMLLPWIVFPCANFYLMETFHHNPFANMNVRVQFLNILLFVCLAVFLWMLTGSSKRAWKIQSITSLGIGILEYYVIAFRGTPVLPWDFFSLKTAASVSADYDYSLEWQAILSILGFIVLILLENKMEDVRLNRKDWLVRLSGGVLAFSIIFGEYQMLKSPQFIANMWIYDKLFTPYAMIKRDGIALAFLLELQYMEVEKPDGYVADKIEDAYQALSGEVIGVETDERLPNVIVVMSEAFSDPAVLGEFTTNQDYMPYLHSLQEGHDNTITGTMNVSVVGGNTANTEFEFLTGSTMAFLPDGSVPYQQYIDGTTDSIASHLGALGYNTLAMHPYNASGWERNEVYPYLGFDVFYSLKNFANVKKVRDYVSDDSCVDRIIKEFERSEDPCFIFNVTMQNHSAYTSEYDNFTPDITVDGADSFALNTYLSLLKLSDAALERLITYLSQVEEETVLVFFGDHQPADSVVADIWEINGVDPDNLTEEQACLRYQVPFVVWANYDIEERNDVMTSANFLGAQVFDWCKIPMNGYQEYLLELSKEFSAITGRTTVNKKGNFVNFSDVEDELNIYNMLQYYRLFG